MTDTIHIHARESIEEYPFRLFVTELDSYEMSDVWHEIYESTPEVRKTCVCHADWYDLNDIYTLNHHGPWCSGRYIVSKDSQKHLDDFVRTNIPYKKFRNYKNFVAIPRLFHRVRYGMCGDITQGDPRAFKRWLEDNDMDYAQTYDGQYLVTDKTEEWTNELITLLMLKYA